MGKQINFFMDIEDQKQFLYYIKDNYNAKIIIGQWQKENRALELSDINKLERYNDINDSMAYLLNMDIENKIELEFINKQNSYFFNVWKSLAIEFSRGRSIADNGFNEGRLYIPIQDWEYNKLDKNKIKAIEKWYQQLSKWLKKNYTKTRDKSYYIGPHTLKCLKDNKIKLILGDGYGYLDKDLNFVIESEPEIKFIKPE